ncbi:ribonuclease III [Candidatus Pelagibacter bacterium]|nr:ribonuclease III [Candidatus Pelagibacter bacterium]|tara:strand:+ start:243 stop:911 length:669 start_codon:yes stop_codon:yes gene_type:complete
MTDLHNELEKIINYKFKNKDILIKSLIHKSYDNNNNNEKLEFLGDRVLGLIISKKLIEIYPDEKEGIIDKKFANLVNKKTCSKISHSINLRKFMYLGSSNKSLHNQTDKIVSDGLEALIGGIYLDGGLILAEKFILNFWKNYIKNSSIPLVDAKTQLQEYSLKMFKVLPKYTFYKKKGPQHNPIFKTDVQIPNSKKIMGIGASKKSAQQNAANKLLKILKII